jgi:hypothetical protein
MVNNIKINFFICFTAFLLHVCPNVSFADDRSVIEYRAKSIKVISGARMRYSEVGFFGTKVGDVGSREIPEVINLGDHITIKGKAVQANIIEVTEYLRDMSYGGKLLAKKGQVRCLIAASKENLPYGEGSGSRDMVWIDVNYCLALK